MNIENLSIDSVYQDPNNVRIHDDKNIEAIKGSLTKFGQQKPIVVDEKNIILAGNGTHLAAIALGWKQISVVRSNLKNFDKMAFALADNRTSELATWDMPKLAEQLEMIEDRELIGFSDDFGLISDDFEFKDNDSDSKEKPLALIIEFQDQDTMDDIFKEMIERNLKVKVK